MAKKVLSYGLTGGIGSGKSTVLNIFKGLGAITFDSDDFCHGLILSGNEAYRPVIDIFGASILKADGEIDRRNLGGIAFSDPERLKALNNILHPFVLKERKKRVSELSKQGKPLIFITEATLIFEAGVQGDFDGTILVVSDEEIRIKRLLERGLGLTEIKKRLSAQWKDDKKIPLAGFIIYNNGSLNGLRENVNDVYKQLWRRF